MGYLIIVTLLLLFMATMLILAIVKDVKDIDDILERLDREVKKLGRAKVMENKTKQKDISKLYNVDIMETCGVPEKLLSKEEDKDENINDR